MTTIETGLLNNKTIEDEEESLINLFRRMGEQQKKRLLQKANFLASPMGYTILKNQPNSRSV